MSNGRLEMGIGAGWNENEFKSYGYSFPKARERIEILEETIEIVKKMWTQDTTNHQGKYFKLIKNYNYPKPLQKPHPPILIGGGGEKFTLQVVARHADKWNYGWGIEDYENKLQILKNHCKIVDRDIKKIRLTYTSDTIIGDTKKEAEKQFVDWRNQQSKVLGKKVSVNLEEFKRNQIFGSPDDALALLKRIVKELGVSEFILYPPMISADLSLMKLIYNDVAKPLREYASSL
jgi:alkanesulfonate monooxygenase SsuD/methylene tetrahydromethanopterin reductase-like flavin-dependent oxidoreductase (luciferase family)